MIETFLFIIVASQLCIVSLLCSLIKLIKKNI